MLSLRECEPGPIMNDGHTIDCTAPPAHHHQQCINHDTPADTDSSSVHTRKLTVDPPHADSSAQRHRFRHHLELRSAWLRALLFADDCWTVHRRFRECGQNCWIQYSPSRDRYRTVANSCNLRFCPICGHRQRLQTAMNAAAIVERLDSDRLKLITLTLKSSPAPLHQQLTYLRASFRRLRQRAVWKNHVTAGFAVIEVTFNNKIRHWHPHIHIVCDSEYFPHHHLKNHWLSITKSSSIVDIRPCAKRLNITNYLAKYLGKPPALSEFDHETHRLLEFRTALNRSRMLIRFGKFPEHTDVNPPDDKSPQDWQQYQPYESVLERFRDHDATAIFIMQCLVHDTGFASTPYQTTPPFSTGAIDELAITALHPP